MKNDLEEKRRIHKMKTEAVRVIENFWCVILEKREEIQLEEQLKSMPKDCRDLYKKFVNLRKQTKNMKVNLSKINK
jgi:hypothetical protein